eukprot:4302737-Amphidinium_carterae.1
MLGPDRRTQFSALQAWTQQHSAALAEDSRKHLKQVILEWQDSRHRHAQAPAGHNLPQDDSIHASPPLSWAQFDAICAANIRVQRHIPSSVQAATKEHIRALLQTFAPNHGGASREQPNHYDLLFVLPKLLWALPASKLPRARVDWTRHSCVLLHSRDWQT